MSAGKESHPKRNPDVTSIDPTIPEFDVPMPQGKRYKARVPAVMPEY